MPAPDSASRYYRRQERLRYTTLSAIIATWRRMRAQANWEQQYREDVGPKILALVAAAQIATTAEANAYIPAVLAELGIDPTGPSVPRAAFVGLAGDGRPVETLLTQSVVVAGTTYNRLREEVEAPVAVGGSLRVTPATPAFDPDKAAREALASAEQWLTLAAATVLSDTARATESANTAARPQVGGYVRMLNPPSCSRCAILAGKFYRWNSGFLRHPRCDCRHIPANESIAGDLTTSADAYFDSLPTSEQDRIFTNAGAQAIRDGADINQVVNARRGMSKAQIYGHDVTTTTVGRRRGRARDKAPRLMPESIYDVAKDRDEAIRLLKLNGFIH